MRTRQTLYFLDACQRRCGAPSPGLDGVAGFGADGSLLRSAAITSKAAASDGTGAVAAAQGGASGWLKRSTAIDTKRSAPLRAWRRAIRRRCAPRSPWRAPRDQFGAYGRVDTKPGLAGVAIKLTQESD